MSATSELKVRLTHALIKAKSAGRFESMITSDGGASNFDAPVIYLPKGTRHEVIKDACKAAELDCFRWDYTGGWVIMGCGSGQGFDNTVGAETAEKVLKEYGFKTGMYYQVD